jgi:DNA-binding transcriptional regulator YiaG
MARYHYTESGLSNVWIENVQVVVDDAGEEMARIQNVRSLHRAIAESIVNHRAGMSGPELRFLRTEMGLTQAELGDVLHKEGLTVGRWERGESPIDQNAETVIRLLSIEKLRLDKKAIEEVASSSVSTAREAEIRIDGSDPADYKIAA